MSIAQNLVRLCSAVWLIAMTEPTQATVYKCVDPSGRTAYQQSPCPESSAAREIAEQPGVTSKTRNAKQSNDTQAVALTLLVKQRCDDAVPGFRAKSATAWAKWRSRFNEQIGTVEADPAYLRKLREMMTSSNAAVRNAELKQLCTDEWIERLDQVSARPKAPDSRLSTPQRTWQRFTDALRTANNDAAVGCLTGTARTTFRQVASQTSAAELASLANATLSTAPLSTYGDFQEFALGSKGGGVTTVTFQKSNGDWLISSM